MKEKEEEKFVSNDSDSSESAAEGAPSDQESKAVEIGMVNVELNTPNKIQSTQPIPDPDAHEEKRKSRRSFLCCGKKNRDDSS